MAEEVVSYDVNSTKDSFLFIDEEEPPLKPFHL